MDQRTSKDVARIREAARVQRAVDRADANLARSRIGDLALVTESAMFAVTEIAMFEIWAADVAPHATGRLEFIAKIGTGAIAQELQRFGSREL
jgi:hypothetical protein